MSLSENIIVIQPEVPHYREDFFDRLYNMYPGRFFVYASSGTLGILSDRKFLFPWERRLGPMKKIAPGLYWQQHALSIPIKSGDIVVVCGAPRCLSNIALILKARLSGARVVWWGHYWSSTSRAWRAKIRFIMMKMARYILLYTDAEKIEYTNLTKNHPNQEIFSLNNGINLDNIIKFRRPYDPAERGRDLLFIGRLSKKSRIDILLQAMTDVSCNDISLDIIGDGEYRSNFQRMAKELGVENRIFWHNGTTDEQEISRTANQCKLFVYPGSVGLSLVHALSYGLPAIIHDDRWGHMPEYTAFSPGKNGIPFKKDDPKSLAKAISRALADDKALQEMSRHAISTTTNTFNTEDMAKRFKEMIDHIRKDAM